jgi:hypothetical protein
MSNKVFIDFGTGERNFSQMKKAKLRGFYTIAIDQKKYSFMKSEHWKLIVDETYIGKISDEFNIPKADEWICGSVLEHMLEDEIHEELQGLKNKIKHTSIGQFHIDLTDHSGGFRHYIEEDYGRRFPVSYLNSIKANAWTEIIRKYFYYSEKKNCFQRSDHARFREIKSVDFLGCTLK